jgi:hypothetical protein
MGCRSVSMGRGLARFPLDYAPTSVAESRSQGFGKAHTSMAIAGRKAQSFTVSQSIGGGGVPQGGKFCRRRSLLSFLPVHLSPPLFLSMRAWRIILCKISGPGDGWLRFVDSHPCIKERCKDGAPTFVGRLRF